MTSLKDVRWGLPVLLAGILLAGLLGLVSRPAVAQGGDAPFTFVVTADVRNFAGPGYDSSIYFRGVVEAIDGLGGGAFMVSPGDIDPPADVLWTITRTLGITYTWYPVVGNHELPGLGSEPYHGANMDWLNSYDYGAVNPGPTGCPTTTYSFDYGNAHFVMLNEYCDSTGDDVRDGDISDHLYNWLADDLSGTARVHTFVFGHEPAYPQPDADNGRVRHLGDSLDQYPAHRDRFWSLLQDEGVLAYFCGHTHNYSAMNVDGVWQVDAGHARGAGDTGAPSTFVVVHVDGGTVTFDAYRDEHDGTYDYDDIIHHTHAVTIHLPVQASFTASPTLGVEPLTVGFTNTSSGDYVDSLWAFGDGVTSTLQSLIHTYTTVAVYTVTLTVSGPGGSDTETKAGYIAVRGRPSVYLPLVVRQPEVFRARHLAPKIATIRPESE
jgi:hypothetical protein